MSAGSSFPSGLKKISRSASLASAAHRNATPRPRIGWVTTGMPFSARNSTVPSLLPPSTAKHCRNSETGILSQSVRSPSISLRVRSTIAASRRESGKGSGIPAVYRVSALFPVVTNLDLGDGDVPFGQQAPQQHVPRKVPR